MSLEAITGDVLEPGEVGYDEARAVWNGMIDVRPAVIARCRDTEDIVRAVDHAAHHGEPVSVRGGGHNVAGTGLVEDGTVIDLSHHRGVEVDVDRRIARVQGGATLGDVDLATHRHGLVTSTGLVSQTGIAGLALRGGFSHTMRRFGLACDNIEAVELVTSSREVVRVSEETDAELLWALRGGPLDLGVVTRFDLRLHPLEPEVRLVMSAFPAERGMELNRFMAEYMAGASRDVGMISFYGTIPDDAHFPAAVRGREVLVLFGMYSGDRSAGAERIAPILQHPDQLADLGGWMAYHEAQAVVDDEYPDGMRHYWKSAYLDELTDDVLRIQHQMGRARPFPATTLVLWTLGGAVHDYDDRTSAFPQRQAKYMVAIEANWEDPEDDEACIAWARETAEALRPHAAGGAYMNFAGSREEYDEAAERTYAQAYDRLLAVRDRVDPIGLFSRAGSGAVQDA